MDTRNRDHELHSEHVKNPEVAYDRTDLSPRGIALFLIALAVAGIVTHFVLWGAYKVLTKNEPEPSQQRAMIVAPKSQVAGESSQVFKVEGNGPILQPDPTADMAKFRTSELEHLYTYGKGTGGANRIPITAAMDALAQQGLPTRPQANQGGQSGQIAPAKSQAKPAGSAVETEQPGKK